MLDDNYFCVIYYPPTYLFIKNPKTLIFFGFLIALKGSTKYKIK